MCCGRDAYFVTRDGSPTNGLNGQQLVEPLLRVAIIGENDRTFTTYEHRSARHCRLPTPTRSSAWTTASPSAPRSTAASRILAASAELGSFTNSYQLVGSAPFPGTRIIPQDGPVGLRTTNQYIGVYALDSIDLTKRLTVTGGGRFNVANI